MFQIESRAHTTLLRVECEIDYSVKADFLEVLLLACNNASGSLEVSLENCPFMDCAGLSALLEVRKLASVPMSVVLRSDSYLWKLFEVAGLVTRLNVVDGGLAVVAA